MLNQLVEVGPDSETVYRDVTTPDYSWLLQGLPQSRVNIHEAKAAATAWETMRLWLAVCWEYGLSLMRAQHALRAYYGLPPPWKYLNEEEEELARVSAGTPDPDSDQDQQDGQDQQQPDASTAQDEDPEWNAATKVSACSMHTA